VFIGTARLHPLVNQACVQCPRRDVLTATDFDPESNVLDLQGKEVERDSDPPCRMVLVLDGDDRLSLAGMHEAPNDLVRVR
jgi:hypothetical protein